MDSKDVFLGGKRGISQDLPDEYHWRIVDRVIFGRKPLLVLTAQLEQDSIEQPTRFLDYSEGMETIQAEVVLRST